MSTCGIRASSAGKPGLAGRTAEGGFPHIDTATES
jgi:hypothetical protein